MTKDKTPSSPLVTWLSPEGLVVLAAAGATAWLASLPLVFVPGILAYAILTRLRYRRSREALERVVIEPLQPDLSGLRPEYAARVSRCVSLQAHILSEIQGATPEHRAMLAPTEQRARGIVRTAWDLAHQLQKLEAGIGAEDARKLAGEAQMIERRIAEARDAAARRGFERVLDRHHQKSRVIEQLRAQWERGDAQLVHLELALETVSAQILRITSATAGATIAGEGGAPIVESLDALAIDVEAAAEAIDEIADAHGLGQSAAPR